MPRAAASARAEAGQRSREVLLSQMSAPASRDNFLARIREAAARGRAHRVALNPQATHDASYVGGGDDKVATFLSEWIAVGGRAERVKGADAARHRFCEFLAATRPVNVIRWRHPLLERLEIDRLLLERQISVC